MNLQETGTLLTFIAELDNRRFTEETAISWHKIIGRYGFDEARRAVEEHFTNSTEWLMPAHLVRIMKSKRRARLDQFANINPNRIDGADVAQELKVRKQLTEAIATGQLTAAMYSDYHNANMPWQEYRNTAGRPQLITDAPASPAPPESRGDVEGIASGIGARKSFN